MTIKEFIKKSLDKISNNYPEFEMLYQYKNSTDTHFIKILADNILKNAGFAQLYFEIIDEFNDLNFNAELCIIDNDALIDLNQPELVLTGNASKSTYKMSYKNFFEIQSSICISTIDKNKVTFSEILVVPKDEIKISFSGEAFQDLPFLDLANERQFAMAA